MENVNVSRLLTEAAAETPNKTATILADGRTIDFATLEAEADRAARLFAHAGIRQGMRVATFVRPGLEFVPVINGLFRLGAVPVFIDPGMKLRNVLACLREVEAEGMVGIPLAHLLRWIFWRVFRSVRVKVLVGRRSLWNRLFGATILAPRDAQLVPESSPPELAAPLSLGRDAPAAIIFTSGSTGVPKGVEITHGVFDGQAKILRQAFAIGPDEIDLVPFPLFALFSAAWGITCVVPDMDPARPAQANGRELAEIITRHGVTHTAGSPAIWRRLFDHCTTNGVQLPSLRRILMAGAPVSPKLLVDSRQVLAPGGHVFTPYGATEALPLTSIRSDEILDDCLAGTERGEGTCVGEPLPGITVRIIAITDSRLETWADVEPLARGEVGEVVAQGDLVTRSYFNRPEANRLAKIRDIDGPGFWHRMGDLGYFDQSGRLWFCGRKDHRVRAATPLYPVQCEGIFNQHPEVQRTALVGVPAADDDDEGGDEIAVLIVMPQPGANERALKADLLRMAADHPVTAMIRDVLFKDSFPVDVRHNIKINRPLLADFARRRINTRGSHEDVSGDRRGRVSGQSTRPGAAGAGR